MEQMLIAINKLQDTVFDYQTINISEDFIKLVNELEHITPYVSENIMEVYNNRILLPMLQAFENQDYLLLADLAEYELKPFIGKIAGGAD